MLRGLQEEETPHSIPGGFVMSALSEKGYERMERQRAEAAERVRTQAKRIRWAKVWHFLFHTGSFLTCRKHYL